MKKGEIYEGIVEKTEFPNRGIIKAEDRRVTVKNALPGQKIRYRLKKLRKGTGEGLLLDVLEPSPVEKSRSVRILVPAAAAFSRACPTRSSCA